MIRRGFREGSVRLFCGMTGDFRLRLPCAEVQAHPGKRLRFSRTRQTHRSRNCGHDPGVACTYTQGHFLNAAICPQINVPPQTVTRAGLHFAGTRVNLRHSVAKQTKVSARPLKPHRPSANACRIMSDLPATPGAGDADGTVSRTRGEEKSIPIFAVKIYNTTADLSLDADKNIGILTPQVFFCWENICSFK